MTLRTAEEIEAELATLPETAADTDHGDNPNHGPGEDLAAETARLAAETDAGRKGWVPKDQYKGDPAKWVDAKVFLERGEKFNANLQKEVAALKRQLESFEGTKKAFAKFHEETLARKDAELKEAIAALRVAKSRATAEGEHEEAVAIEDRIELLKEERQAVKTVEVEQTQTATSGPGPNPEDPVLLEWIEDGNSWFQDDPALRDYAVTLGENLIKQGTTVRGRKFLDLVRTHMEENFPRKFRAFAGGGNPAPRSGAEPPSGRGPASGPTGGKTERDLPAEDLALMKQFIKEGWTTKEKFLAGYFSR